MSLSVVISHLPGLTMILKRLPSQIFGCTTWFSGYGTISLLPDRPGQARVGSFRSNLQSESSFRRFSSWKKRDAAEWDDGTSSLTK